MVVVPAAIRERLVEHASEEAPNEACGVVVLQDGVAERYVAGRNGAASPYRFELEVPPDGSVVFRLGRSPSNDAAESADEHPSRSMKMSPIVPRWYMVRGSPRTSSRRTAARRRP